MSLRMPARVAACRFASSRRATRHPGAAWWLPLALRWRRARRRARALAARGASRAASPGAVWLAHVHLHLSLTASDRRRNAPRAFGPAARKRELPQTRPVRPLAIIRNAGASTPRPAGSRRSRECQPIAVAGRTFDETGPVAAFAAVAAKLPLLAGCAARHAESPGLGPAVAVRRETAAKRSSSGPVGRRAAAVTRERVVGPVVLSRLRAAMTSPSDDPKPALQRPLRRPPELVWPAAARLPAQLAGERSDVNPSPSSTRAVPRSETPAEAAGGETRDSLRTNLQPRDLDPALVDRLTDDVIRRVERRVRIERERRGM